MTQARSQETYIKNNVNRNPYTSMNILKLNEKSPNTYVHSCSL